MNAVELLSELRGFGAIIQANGDRLQIAAPKGVVTPELRKALVEHKAEILALITITENEIAWRVTAMLPQIPTVGPLPFLVAKQGCKSQDGHCLSCGEWLSRGDAYRCSPCGRAANLAIELAVLRNDSAAKDEKDVSSLEVTRE